MLYTSQNKLIYNMEHAIKTKGFRESTDYAQSFQVAFTVKLKVFVILLTLYLASIWLNLVLYSISSFSWNSAVLDKIK